MEWFHASFILVVALTYFLMKNELMIFVGNDGFCEIFAVSRERKLLDTGSNFQTPYKPFVYELIRCE